MIQLKTPNGLYNAMECITLKEAKKIFRKLKYEEELIDNSLGYVMTSNSKLNSPTFIPLKFRCDQLIFIETKNLND